MPWGKQHPILAIFMGLFGALLVVTGEWWAIIVGALIVLGSIGSFLEDEKKPKQQPEKRQSSVNSGVSATSKKQPERPKNDVAWQQTSVLNRASVTSLSSQIRAELTNRIELDEELDFAVHGSNSSALVASDRRLFLVLIKRWSADVVQVADYNYSEIQNISINHRGSKGALVIHRSEEADKLELGLANQEQIERALDSIPEIRRRIASARVSDSEQPTPNDQSAFAETSARQIQPSISQTNGLNSYHFSVISLGDMLTMTPQEFEEFTGEALSAMGYTNVNRVGGSGDLAADLTATDPQGRSAIVQCKRYTPGSKVGSPALQQFIGMKSVHHQADRGIFVTTADYSQQAIDLAKQHQIVLIDGDDLVKIAALVMTKGVNPSPPTTPTDDECKICGRINDPESRYCAACGASLRPRV